jgi:hypothetical protein
MQILHALAIENRGRRGSLALFPDIQRKGQGQAAARSRRYPKGEPAAVAILVIGGIHESVPQETDLVYGSHCRRVATQDAQNRECSS